MSNEDDLKTKVTKLEVKVGILWTALWGMVTANAGLLIIFINKILGV